jgi:predicted ATPase
VGKTRLAVEAAAALREEHRDGAWLVEFASVTEPDGVAPAVAGALGAATAGLIGPPSPDSTIQVPAGEVLDVLSRLVDKSLVAAPNAGRDARFIQLQTLWQYGRDRLDESGEAGAICARHGAYYRQMAEQAHEGLRGASGPRWRESQPPTRVSSASTRKERSGCPSTR